MKDSGRLYAGLGIFATFIATMLTFHDWPLMFSICLALALATLLWGAWPWIGSFLSHKVIGGLILLAVLFAGWWISRDWSDRHLRTTLNNSGIEYFEANRLDEARQAFEGVLEVDPKSVEAMTNLARLENVEGNITKALSLYREAARLRPSSALHHFNLGQILLERDSLAEAANSLRLAVEIDPNYAEAFNALGLSLLRLERRIDAQKAFEEGLASEGETNPVTEATLRKNLGAALLSQTKYREAINHLGKVLEDSSFVDANREARFLLAKAHARLGEREQACSHLKAFVSLNGLYSSRGPGARELNEQEGCLTIPLEK